MDPRKSSKEHSPVPERLDAAVDQAVHLLGPGETAANHVAARQQSVLHLRQLTRIGLGRKAREHRVARGSWQRLYPRVFLVGTQPPSDRARMLAATLDAGWHAAATAHTAAFSYGLTSRLDRTLHVAMLGRHNAARRPGVRIHRPRFLAWDQVRFRRGVPVVNPTEMLLSLATEVDADVLEAMVALAVRRNLLSLAGLRRTIETSAARPGLPALRAAARAPALTRSGNERLLLSLVRRAELPEPETNVTVEDKELDAYWADARVGVEVDAFSTHGSLAAFEDDRVLDVDMEAADIRILRFTGSRIRRRPEAVAARIAAVLTLRLGGLPPRRRRR